MNSSLTEISSCPTRPGKELVAGESGYWAPSKKMLTSSFLKISGCYNSLLGVIMKMKHYFFIVLPCLYVSLPTYSTVDREVVLGR